MRQENVYEPPRAPTTWIPRSRSSKAMGVALFVCTLPLGAYSVLNMRVGVGREVWRSNWESIFVCTTLFGLLLYLAVQALLGGEEPLMPSSAADEDKDDAKKNEEGNGDDDEGK